MGTWPTKPPSARKLTPDQVKAVLRFTAQQLPPDPRRSVDAVESLLTQGPDLIGQALAVIFAEQVGNRHPYK